LRKLGPRRMDTETRRQWVVPTVLLSSIAIGTFALLFTLDHYVTGRGPYDAPNTVFERYFGFDPDKISDAVSALGGMVAAVLGIVITVVSIVVQLSAERYTGVTKMFFRDRTNMGVLGFYVIACVCGIWVSVSLRAGWVPRATLITMMLSCTTSIVLMAPYFAYVFRFLEPANIIARISVEAVASARQGTLSPSEQTRAARQSDTLSAMEELTDITSNSISGKDKVIASNAVDALKDLAIDYLSFKQNASAAWFRIGDDIRKNPDFVAMDPESLTDLEQRRTWVEWKVMRQYLGIYNEALGGMRDINYLIAINTRYLGEAAAKEGDDELVKLVVRFMNSYLRATLNARDVRTAYNVLNQYRLLVESFLKTGRSDDAAAAVGYMKYYGHTSFQMNLPFVAETVAYDVCSLCALAHELNNPQEDAMLRAFLDLDIPSSEREKEIGLKGVRKAQVKLAAYYIVAGDREKAERIRDDMAAEPPDRLQAIRHELERVTTKDFWEIIDRGRNFEFMPPEQKAAMATFFSWLGTVPRPRAPAPSIPLG
jgi:hypothetical protein